MLVYIFAIKETTKEVFEVLGFEVYQGEVMYLELLDANGMTHQLDQPEGFVYKFRTEKEVDYDS